MSRIYRHFFCQKCRHQEEMSVEEGAINRQSCSKCGHRPIHVLPKNVKSYDRKGK